MVVTRRLEIGSRLGLEAGSQDRSVLLEDRVSEIIWEEVIEIVRGQIPEMIGSFKTFMVEYLSSTMQPLLRRIP